MPPRLASADILVHRVPIDRPVQTSFGMMENRPSLLIRLEDADGCVGWGEVWCNFPSIGAEYRARMLEAIILPAVSGLVSFEEPAALWSSLNERFAVLAIQAGENGPVSQCLAGLDCALHDLAARRAGQPLWRFLSPEASAYVPVYASGIDPAFAEPMVRAALEDGHAAAKVKVGFGHDRDAPALTAARGLLGPDRMLMADANQAWSLDEALAFLPLAEAAGLTWLEEPLRHTDADAAWRTLAETGTVALAAGENFASIADFDDLPASRRLDVVQPDLGKWGGVGRSLRVGRAAGAAGRAYCPHWLGAGVGLLASLHVKAACGGRGMAEIDVNPNPMRTELAATALETLQEGGVRLPDTPGIGDIEARLPQFDRYLTHRARFSFPSA